MAHLANSLRAGRETGCYSRDAGKSTTHWPKVTNRSLRANTRFCASSSGHAECFSLEIAATKLSGWERRNRQLHEVLDWIEKGLNYEILNYCSRCPNTLLRMVPFFFLGTPVYCICNLHSDLFQWYSLQ